MHEAGCSGLVHWEAPAGPWCSGLDPEGWDGEGGEREGQDVEHMYNHSDSCEYKVKTTSIL